MRHLVSLVDGTWLTPTVVAGGNINSNIFRINNFLKCQASDGNPQIVFYSRGLGAVSGIQKYTAGGFASNIKEEIEDTYINIASNYTEGDKIYLFGFSRGAVIARVVAGLISNAGLLSSWHLDKFPDIWALYKSGGMRDDEFPPEYCEPRAKVEFLGVFDTVYGGNDIPSAEYWGPITRSDLHRSLALEIDDGQRLVPVRVFRREQCALPPRENTSSDYALLGRLLLGAKQTWSRDNRMTAADPKR